MKNIIWVHKVTKQAVRTSGGCYIIVPPEVKDTDLFPTLIDIDGKQEAKLSLWLCESEGERIELKQNILKDGRRDSEERTPEWRLSGDIITYLKELDNPLTITLGFYKDAEENICFESIPESSLLKKIPPIKKNGNNRVSDVVQNLDSPSVESDSILNFTIDLHLSKPFILLAGISGTGKTRFVREQVKAIKQFNEAYCLTSVRPDWHEPSDLLGYISRLNGNAEYVTTDVLQFIGKAWRGIADSDLAITAQNIDGQGVRLVVSGDSASLNGLLPYWLCLDEMNLAPVEQYFADYLSVLETREWEWNGDAFTYSCDPLLKSTVLSLTDKDGNIDIAYNTQLRNSLGFIESKYDDLWSLICKFGLSIPFNLMVAGTVNMDETTHGFSRKVIDRALSFDFGEFFPNDYNQFFSPENKDKTLSFPIYSHAKIEHLTSTVDSDGRRSINFLGAVNKVLANTPFQLAYRALNELLLAVISTKPQDELTLKAVWDDFLMCKVLPRIEGDVDKLGSEPSLLEQLEKVLAEDKLKDIWNELANSATARPDLFREKKSDVDDADTVITIGCRSKTKITGMQTRLRNTSFTSFWP